MWSSEAQTATMEPLDPVRDSEALAATIRVARRIHNLERPVLGLAPINARAKVAPTTFHVATAFVGFAGESIAIVGPGGPGSAYEALRSAASAAPGGEAQRDDCVVLPLPNAITLFLSARKSDALGIVAALRVARQTHHRVLCDLTGLQEKGELEWTFPHLDGLLLVACAGRTKESEIINSLQRGAPLLWRQVLLVGG
jgi:hypothetical protein